MGQEVVLSTRNLRVDQHLPSKQRRRWVGPFRISSDAVIFAVQEYFIDNGSVRQWLMEYNDCTQALCIICQNPHGRDRYYGIDS